MERVWIQTRDGSPTLWSNELSESYRSLKGAFTESYFVFIKHALYESQKLKGATLMEFGLGPGTNWLLWSLLAPLHGITDYKYYAIERDPQVFVEGKKKWFQLGPTISQFLKKINVDLSSELVLQRLSRAPEPVIFLNATEACASSVKADLWFHDPFDVQVNPEGYTAETFLELSKLWARPMRAYTYAANRTLREALEKIPGLKYEACPTGIDSLKRERSVFWIECL